MLGLTAKKKGKHMDHFCECTVEGNIRISEGRSEMKPDEIAQRITSKFLFVFKS
jgi:hypothetical protein